MAQLGGSDGWSWSCALAVPVLVLPPSGCVIGPHTLQLMLLVSEGNEGERGKCLPCSMAGGLIGILLSLVPVLSMWRVLTLLALSQLKESRASSQTQVHGHLLYKDVPDLPDRLNVTTGWSLGYTDECVSLQGH